MALVRWLSLLVLSSSSGCDCGDGAGPDGDADADVDVDTDADGDTDADADADGDADGDADAGPPPCVDADGDTYGEHCAAGSDCDDADPARHFGCGVDCAADPMAQGCPCAAGDPPPTCYDGDPGLLGTGACVGGSRSCDHSEWGPCDGQVLPREEICDGTDDDCDGTMDEEVLSECGNCDPACRLDDQGHGTFDQDAMDGVVDDEAAGGLIITTETREAGYAWIANAAEGTVSKLDLETGAEVGRFRTGVGGGVDDWGVEGGSPSRTAVDGDGNAFVAARSFGIQGTVSKIAAEEVDCVDRNANGAIDTSRDSITLAYQGAALGTSDECVLWTVPVGPDDGIPRGLAIDAGDVAHPEGYPWVGLFGARQLAQLDPDTGATLQTVDVSGRPYGLAISLDGRIWMPDYCCGGNGIESYDPATGVLSGMIAHGGEAACRGQYGVAVDGDARVWLGGYPCARAFRYDPADGSWFTVDMPRGVATGRGIAVDGVGNVWMAAHAGGDGFLFGFDADDGSIQYDVDIAGTVPVGAGVDDFGRIWTANQSSDSATRYDPASGVEDTFPVGLGPYTYSDFTGFQRRNFTAPRGTYSQIYESDCYIGVPDWSTLTWEVTTPEGTSLRFEVQSAADEALLDAAPVVVLAEVPDDVPPVDVGDALAAAGVAPDAFLRLTIVLLSLDRETSPVVHGYSLTWECAGD
jgi:DNA-binding beta-propeller fold protein YncE